MRMQKEIEDIIRVGYLNGLFVLARSIGLIGAFSTFDKLSMTTLTTASTDSRMPHLRL
jgi:hypothetical protein